MFVRCTSPATESPSPTPTAITEHHPRSLTSIPMPTSQPICTCISHGCGEKETTDESGHLLRGKRLGVQECWDHHRQDKRLKSMAHAAHHQEGNSNTSPDTASLMPMPQSVGCHDQGLPKSGDSHSIPSGSTGSCTMTWTSQEDELASTLESCLSVFRSGLIEDISIKDLVFCKPSKDDDSLTPPPLQSLATANTEFLKYQDWIMELWLETEKLDCGSFERCRNIKAKLLDDLRNEWTRLEELKRRAWLLATQNDFTIPPRPEPGLAQIIDTCKCHSNPS
jgi:hypothetical protein